MITTCSNQREKCGSVLLVTMIFILTVAVLLVSYFGIVLNSNRMVNRSQGWNSALTLAEAGIEEGLAAMNSGSSFSTINRTLNEGTYTVTYVPGSTIYIRSVGQVKVPITGDIVSRTVQVGLRQRSLFMRGLAAINNIRFNGNGISSDSWNSHDTNQSLNGLYNGYVGTNGDVASVQGLVDIGNHTINGNLYLGPNASFSGSTGQVTGIIYTDANLQYNDISLPTPTDTNGNAISWTTAVPTSITTVTLTTNINSSKVKGVTTYTTNIVFVTNSTPPQLNFTNSGYYIVNDSTTPIEVYPGVNVTLDVKSFNFNPSALNIDGGTVNSGNVSLYLELGTITLAGNSTGGASGNRPENLFIYGLPGVTSITLSGNSSFVGAIYAPEAILTLNGGGNANNLIGAAVVNSVTLNGHYDFHYDTWLGQNQNGGYVVSSWQEL